MLNRTERTPLIESIDSELCDVLDCTVAQLLSMPKDILETFRRRVYQAKKIEFQMLADCFKDKTHPKLEVA